MDRVSLVRALVDRLHRKERRSAVEKSLDLRASGSIDFVAHTLLAWVLSSRDDYQGSRKIADEHTVQRLLNLTWHMSASTQALALFGKNPFLAMRNMAIQQSAPQENLLQSAFGRSWVIFSVLPPNHRLRVFIEAMTDMPLKDSMALVLLFSMSFLQGDSALLKSRIFQYARNAFSTFPRLRTLLIANKNAALSECNLLGSKFDSLFAPSQFIRYPLINVAGSIEVVDPVSAAKTGEHFFARLIEEFGEEDHKRELTRLYEAYANARLISTQPSGAVVGQDLRKIVRHGKACDQFVRIDSECVLLVEIKCRAVASNKMMAISESYLSSLLSDVVNVGFTQLANTRDQLTQCGEIKATDRVVMLLVTRENFFLPQSEMLAEVMPGLKPLMEKLTADSRSEFCNCCLDEYDARLDLAAAGRVSLADFFSAAGSSGLSPIRSRSGLHGRLRTSAEIHVAQHLHEAMTEASEHAGRLIERLMERKY